MKNFSERNPAIIGVCGAALVLAAVVGALEYDKLPFFAAQKSTYEAFFAESSGLDSGARVLVSGFQVGAVSSVELDGPAVLVKFTVDKSIRLGDRSEAAVKTKSLLGAKQLEVIPRGEGELSGPIPIDRTTPAYQLPDAFGDLAQTVGALQTDKLNESLTTIAETFRDTPPDVKAALKGIGRISQTIAERDQQLRSLLDSSAKVTGVLAQRSDAVVSLIGDSNALLAQLQTQSSSLESIATSISEFSKQLSGLVADNRSQMGPALDKLNGVLQIVDNRKERVQKAIKLLNTYAMSLGESVSSGPFFKAYVANLIPGQFIQPFIDAAFSDLGLDPSVLLPSERTDPQTGQHATPPLPIPYPRTGQGGEPRMNLPDAITGNPGDPRYPYREPLPAPAPGGPPPGPPAASPPGLASAPEPTPSPIYVPAPNEVSAPQSITEGR